MIKQKSQFPFYEEINDFLKSITSLRTKNPLFYCFRFKGKVDQVLYKPPYRKGFYSVLLVSNSGNYEIHANNKEIKTYNSFLILQAPGQLMSYKYKIGMHSKGYLIFFKPELFSFLKKSFLNEFSYLEMLQTETFELNDTDLLDIETNFEDIFNSYEKNEKIASFKMLILLHLIKDFSQIIAKQSEQKILQGKGGEVIFHKFLQLVSVYYLEKRTLKEYANMLSVSPNYLSLQIKHFSDKSPLSFINSKLISEAKSLILYTDYNINEISQQLNFSNSSNFVKFFKKQTGQTTIEFKKKAQK
jgi:AraC-like DNA-binding protein